MLRYAQVSPLLWHWLAFSLILCKSKAVYRQTDRQTNRQTNRQTYIHIYIYTQYIILHICEMILWIWSQDKSNHQNWSTAWASSFPIFPLQGSRVSAHDLGWKASHAWEQRLQSAYELTFESSHFLGFFPLQCLLMSWPFLWTTGLASLPKLELTVTDQFTLLQRNQCAEMLRKKYSISLNGDTSVHTAKLRDNVRIKAFPTMVVWAANPTSLAQKGPTAWQK